VALQRFTNRLVHAACGKLLGLFVYIFNGLLYGVSVIALGGYTQTCSGVVNNLTFCGA